MTDRKTKQRRLERAGYDCLKDVWVPTYLFDQVMRQAMMHRADVERILAEPPKPRGWPKGKARNRSQL